MDPVLAASLAVGALAAAGALVAVGELLPATPALGAALRRLHGDVDQSGEATGRGVLRWLSRRFPVPRDDLALLGYRPERYAATVLVAAGAGAASPLLVGAVLAAAGRIPPAAPLGGGVLAVVAAVGFAVAAHRDIGYRARRLRTGYRQVIAVYLTLVAMERGAGHGTVEALERAGQVGDHPVVYRIRDALLRARSHHRPPWEELAELGERIGVPELTDVGQIMRGSGLSGAQVHRTLLDRAASLRDQIRTDALARAEATTGRLEIPGAVLLLVLAAFVIYPITQRIYLGM